MTQRLAAVPSKRESGGNPNPTRHPAALAAQRVCVPPHLLQLGVPSGPCAPPRCASCSLPGSKAGAKAAAVRAGALWQLFRTLKAAAWCLLRWEAPGQAREKEKSRVPPLTPSRTLASPSPAPLPTIQSPATQKSPPEASPPGHAPSPSSGEMLRCGRSGAGAGKSSRAASGCNHCLQNWLSSLPASGQVSCFPQDPQPIAACAGVSHGRCSRLRPWSSAGLCPRRGVRAETPHPRGNHPPQARRHAAPAPLPRGISPLGLVRQLQSCCGAVAARFQPSCPGQPHSDCNDHHNNVVTSLFSLLRI